MSCCKAKDGSEPAKKEKAPAVEKKDDAAEAPKEDAAEAPKEEPAAAEEAPAAEWAQIIWKLNISFTRRNEKASRVDIQIDIELSFGLQKHIHTLKHK